MTGVLFALIAMVGWGFADFFAQRSSRVLGIVNTLFAGSLFGLVVITPLMFRELGSLPANPSGIVVLAISTAIGIFTALFSMAAFRDGKMAVVEPIMGLELPFTILLAVFLRGERVDAARLAAMAVVFIGALFVAVERPSEAFQLGKNFEKGVLFGLIGAVGLGASNFMTGVASQDTSPLLAVWFGRAAFAVIFGGYLLASRGLGAAWHAIKKHPWLVCGVSSLYLVSYVGFGIATTLIPISVATTISEGYIVLTVLLGVFVNREKLTMHQIVGIVATLAGVGLLSYIQA